MEIKYSICICNYNMDSTLVQSLESILNQINENYEVVVVDDGSSDNSLSLLIKLRKKYNNLRVIPLIRDSRRKLGETRNISIRASRGKYVLVHLDTDDYWDEHISSFPKVYHSIEERLNISNFMLSGHQIHMASRDLLIENPYPNIYYVEDRLLWNKLAVLGKLICIDHKIFRKRIPLKNKKLKLIKAFKSQFSSMCAAYSYTPNPFKTTYEYLKMIKSSLIKSYIFSTITAILLFPSFISGFFLKRENLVSSVREDYRKFNLLNLVDFENKYLKKFGRFDLDEKDRIIYFH